MFILVNHFLSRSQPLWVNALVTLNDSSWSFLNGSDFDPLAIQDLRLSHWAESYEIPDNISSCAQLLPSGIIEPLNNGSCLEKKKAACMYRTCLTTQGEECIFPFRYKNITIDGIETDLTYNECSTVHLYKPWCPTGNFKLSLVFP